MSQPLHPTILPERRSWLRRRGGSAAVAASPASEPVRPAGLGEPAGPPAVSDAAPLDAVAGLERLAARAPELAARQAAERAWREREQQRDAEAAASRAAEQERLLREESLDMAERLASLVQQRAEQRTVAAGAWDAVPAWDAG